MKRAHSIDKTRIQRFSDNTAPDLQASFRRTPESRIEACPRVQPYRPQKAPRWIPAFAGWTVRGVDRSRGGSFAGWIVRGVDRSRGGPFAGWTVRGVDRSRDDAVRLLGRNRLHHHHHRRRSHMGGLELHI
ncbi:MAG: hypothetical protein GY859_15825 [Desulfobacterales bacterium]|nr:hypothetical protein [Desulfobacterales bacterium]